MQIGDDPTDTGSRAQGFLMLDRRGLRWVSAFSNTKSELQMPYHLVLCRDFGVEARNAGRNGRFMRL